MKKRKFNPFGCFDDIFNFNFAFNFAFNLAFSFWLLAFFICIGLVDFIFSLACFFVDGLIFFAHSP